MKFSRMEFLAKLLKISLRKSKMQKMGDKKNKSVQNKGRIMIKGHPATKTSSSSSSSSTSPSSLSLSSSCSGYSVSDFLHDLEDKKHVADDKTSTPLNLNIAPLNTMRRRRSSPVHDVSGVKLAEDATEEVAEKVVTGRRVFVSDTYCHSDLYENMKFFKDFTKQGDTENEYEEVIGKRRKANGCKLKLLQSLLR